MNAIIPGKVYDLRNFKSQETQRVTFTHKVKDGEFAEGTTNEEVLDMMIDRLFHFQEQNFEFSNAMAIEHLKNAKKSLKKRSRRKKVKYHGGESQD